MSAIITGAVVGAVIASSAAHRASEPMTQGMAVSLLVLIALSLVGGAVCAYRSRWEKWENMFFGTICTACGLFLLVGLTALIAVAVGL